LGGCDPRRRTFVAQFGIGEKIKRKILSIKRDFTGREESKRSPFIDLDLFFNLQGRGGKSERFQNSMSRRWGKTTKGGKSR